MADAQVPTVSNELPETDNLAIGFKKEIILDQKCRDLIESYCKLPSDQVVPHLYAVREKAWKVFPWPCVGMWSFVVPTINTLPQYSSIISRVKEGGQRILDLGCALGQDVRQMIADGVPDHLVYGVELEAGFIDLGYDLFLDRDTLKSQFISADVLEKSGPNPKLAAWDGKIDIIYNGRFLHCFDRDDGLVVAMRMTKLLSNRSGSVIVGECLGGRIDREVVAPIGKLHLYSIESFKEMWTQAAEKTKVQFKVDVQAQPAGQAQMAHFGEDVVSLVFWVERL
ncbi:hypothetical protein K432DRAFT_410206 [Lepidopterella palustris CBS 459.81]|uniref:Methyltransferase domain-containing protein n=1 Tax=Lepidopterella palustris CBS 459.81 TaxID=1314670 RepID=A0A8E2DYC0_9PEZI|nr:hypothetical protein K432DRAFT_410206 [Lepidopterella palustris CBS 459.81]